MENGINKLDFIKEVERVVRMTTVFKDLNITYGWLEIERYDTPDEDGKYYVKNKTFHESDRVLNEKNDPREMLRFRWGKQSDLYCIYRSIEADSYWGILIDVMDGLKDAE